MYCISISFGAYRSLVAHLVWDQRVAGSNPAAPTIMKKALIYKPTKSVMQSGIKKYDKWVVEFLVDKPGINPLMGWESSTDTSNSLKLEFKTKELAIEYAKKNKIDFELIESKIRKINKKSYADNFTK